MSQKVNDLRLPKRNVTLILRMRFGTGFPGAD